MTNPIKWLTNKSADDGCIPNSELLQYGIGMGGLTANSNFISSWFFYFCTDVLKIKPGAVGVITSLSRIWDGVNDPIVGAYIDGRRNKSGSKFHTYLTRLPFFIGIISMLMFFDFGFSTGGTIAYVTIIYLGWDFLYSFQETSAWGTLSLMSPHSHERERATQWLYIGANAGPAAVALVPLIMGFREIIGISEKTEFIFFGIIYGLGCEMISLMTCKGKERVVHESTSQPSVFKHILSVKENKTLLLLIAAQFLGSLSLTLPQIYFFKYMVSYNIGGHELNGETVLFIYNLVMATPGTLGLFFTNKAAGKLGGMKNVILFSQVMNVVLRFVSYAIGYDTIGKMAGVTFVMAIATIPAMMVGIATRALICDSIDYVEWKTGKRTEAISFSLQSLVTKITSAMGNLISGLLLSGLKYDSSITNLAGQNPVFYKYQWALYIIGPALGAALYIIPTLKIRDKKEEKEQIEKELAERHKAVAASEQE